MSFQSYLNNIETKTGKAPADFKELAEAKGFVENDTIKEGIKATQITDWLKEEYKCHGNVRLVKGQKILNSAL